MTKANRIHDLLVTHESGMVMTGFEPGGATGVHDIDWRSLDNARMPSCFLYEAEPLGDVIPEYFHG